MDLRVLPKNISSQWVVRFNPTHGSGWDLLQLKIHFQAKLENARVAGGGDGAEARGSCDRVWRSQRRGISHVKNFSTKLDVTILTEVSAFY